MDAKGESGVMHASCSDTGRVEHDSPKIWTPIVPIKMDPIVEIQAEKEKAEEGRRKRMKEMIVLGSMQYQHRIESSCILTAGKHS